MRYQRAELPLKLEGLAAARRFFSDCLAEQDPMQEHLWVAHLDRENRCVHLSSHSGRADGIDFPLRRILVDAAVHGTAGLVIAHNHPSGDARPSVSDLAATRRLAAAADALDCRLFDHLIFAGPQWTSMREMRLL